MKTIMPLVVLFFALLCPATWAQNYTYTFYDNINGTGHVVATYTGPLITPLLTGATSGFVINPTTFARYTSDAAFASETAMEPCNWGFLSSFGTHKAFCTTSNLLQFSWDYSALPTGPGTYDTGGAAVFLDRNLFPVAQIPTFSLIVSLATPAYSCTGFQSPFDVALSLKQKVQRAIPLQMQLLDADNNVVTDATIPGAAPVVNITFMAVSTAAVDETSLLDAIGQSSSGNSFSYDATTQTWNYNLSSSPFTASGTYTVTVTTGDSSQYSVSPTCTGTFVRK